MLKRISASPPSPGKRKSRAVRLAASTRAFTRKLEEMGLLDGERKRQQWDFSNAEQLLLWCHGPACGEAPRASKGLLKVD